MSLLLCRWDKDNFGNSGVLAKPRLQSNAKKSAAADLRSKVQAGAKQNQMQCKAEMSSFNPRDASMMRSTQQAIHSASRNPARLIPIFALVPASAVLNCNAFISLPPGLTMNTLTAINKKIEELKKQADAIVKAEKREAIAKVRDLIAKFGLVAEDVGLGKASKRGRAAAAKKPAGATAKAAKYRDPATGKTWTGVGRAPAWIADAKDRSKFLIEGSSVAVAAAESAPAKAGSKEKAAPVKQADKATKGSKASAPAKPVAAKKAKRAAAKSASAAPESGSSAADPAAAAAQA